MFSAVEASLGAARRYSPADAQIAVFRAMFLSAAFKTPLNTAFLQIRPAYPFLTRRSGSNAAIRK